MIQESLMKQQFKREDAVKLLLIYFAGIQMGISVLFLFVFYMIYGRNATPGAGISVLIYLVGALLLLYLYRGVLKQHWINFKNKYFENAITIVKNYIIGFFLSSIASYIITALVNRETSVNQGEIVKMFQENMLLVTVMTVLLAPIIEEVVFRGAYFSLRESVSDTKAMWISSLIFGFIHIISGLSFSNLIELVFIFPYAIMGYYMCLSAKETDSIWGSILHHALSNFIAIVFLYQSIIRMG